MNPRRLSFLICSSSDASNWQSIPTQLAESANARSRLHWCSSWAQFWQHGENMVPQWWDYETHAGSRALTPATSNWTYWLVMFRAHCCGWSLIVPKKHFPSSSIHHLLITLKLKRPTVLPSFLTQLQSDNTLLAMLQSTNGSTMYHFLRCGLWWCRWVAFMILASFSGYLGTHDTAWRAQYAVERWSQILEGWECVSQSTNADHDTVRRGSRGEGMLFRGILFFIPAETAIAASKGESQLSACALASTTVGNCFSFEMVCVTIRQLHPGLKSWL